MMRKGIGPRPNEKQATKPRLAITVTRRQEYTIPRPRKRLANPILQMLHKSKGLRPLRSMREVDGRVVARLTRDIKRDIRADEDGKMDERMEVE